METLRAIVTRRKTLKYKPSGPLSKTARTDLLRAAMSAPSAGKKKPWHFVVLEEDEALRELTGLLRERDSLHSAAMATVVCADAKEQEHMGHWAIDCSAATQNLILAAHDKGLGSAWLRIFPSKSRMKVVGEFLDLPDHVSAFSVVFVGEAKQPLTERAAALQAERAHWGRW